MKKGKWYFIKEHGFDKNLKGKFTGEQQNGLSLMRFYWGNPWRNKEWIRTELIGDECRRPSLFSNI